MTGWLLVSVLACSENEAQTETSGIEGEIHTEDASGLVHGMKAFGYSIGDQGAWYVASTDDATCADVVTYLSTGPVDPVSVHAPGHCNLSLTASLDEGAVSFDETENFLVGFWNLSCALGEGVFAWEERENGYADWFWSGYSWTGIATEHQTVVSSAKSGGWTIDVTMGAFDGDYDEQGDIPAQGEVLGVVVAEPCSGLVGTALLPG